MSPRHSKKLRALARSICAREFEKCPSADLSTPPRFAVGAARGVDKSY